MASTRTARRGGSSSWRIKRGWSRMKNFGLRPCRRVTMWRIPIAASQSRVPSFVTVKRSSLRCLSSWRRSCGRVDFDGSLTFINRLSGHMFSRHAERYELLWRPFLATVSSKRHAVHMSSRPCRSLANQSAPSGLDFLDFHSKNRHFYKRQTSIFIKMPVLAKIRCKEKGE